MVALAGRPSSAALLVRPDLGRPFERPVRPPVPLRPALTRRSRSAPSYAAIAAFLTAAIAAFPHPPLSRRPSSPLSRRRYQLAQRPRRG